MTNLQAGGTRVSGRLLRQLWLALPMGLGAALAVVVLGVGVVPQWLALQQERERLAALEARRDEVALLRRQLVSLAGRQQQESQRRQRLTQLVTGRGGLTTLMATLDRQARATGVQLDLYEPQAAAAPAASGAVPAGGAAPAAAATPPPAQGTNPAPAARPGAGTPAPPGGAGAAPVPELAGLTRHTVLLAAQGSFPALLAFLQRMEALSVLVVQSDLNLSLDRPKTVDPTKPQPLPAVVLKLVATLYEPAAAPRP